jgi:hypothetical protein
MSIKLGQVWLDDFEIGGSKLRSPFLPFLFLAACWLDSSSVGRLDNSNQCITYQNKTFSFGNESQYYANYTYQLLLLIGRSRQVVLEKSLDQREVFNPLIRGHLYYVDIC